ncbi:MAG TPA: hypothetical protein VGF76_18030 [Polyangiaceae bacterium]|jgi:ABC-type transport system involved in cytochrome bd biosynthesis fused ATPase/permease subunit
MIVVLERGRIQEVGDHDCLLSRGGAYASMLKRQLQDADPAPIRAASAAVRGEAA